VRIAPVLSVIRLGVYTEMPEAPPTAPAPPMAIAGTDAPLPKADG
jgi:hypothetical protein